MRLILASSSKTRKEVLDRIGFSYEVLPSNIDEISDKIDFREYVMDLSRCKAEVVAKKVLD